MRYVKTDLAGKIRNLRPFRSEALLPLFEAVVNSIHAIDDQKSSAGKIHIRILRDKDQRTLDLGEDYIPPIIGFEIEDNGIGFNDANLESFETADSTYKQSRGGKGLGRFLWLKAFDSVAIKSVYSNEKGKFSEREISFDIQNGVQITKQTESHPGPSQTIVTLNGFSEDYRKLPSAYKTPEKIAQRILEHCLTRFISNQAPEIVVSDPFAPAAILLSSLFKEIKSSIETENLEIKSQLFDLHHIKLYGTRAQTHQITYCADARDVKSKSIASLLGTSSQFDDNGEKFFYCAYVTSPYLDAHVDDVRQAFSIPDQPDLSTDGILTLSEIEAEIVGKVKFHLSEIMKDIDNQKHERAARYVSEAPMLRAVLKYCPEALREIEPNSSDERVAQVLYSHKGRAELQIRKNSAQLLKTQPNSFAEVSGKIKELNEKLDDFQKDSLAGYILLRKIIIELLEKKLELNADGKHSNEDIVHDIVFPRKTDTNLLDYSNHNLWLIDELLSFHRFAASDKPLNVYVNSQSDERPDIVIFSEIDEHRRARAVSVVEFKKPQRTKFDEDPTKQLYRYVREIRNAKNMRDGTGRDVAIDDSTRFYCYAICDLTTQVKEFAENGNFAQMSGEFGYYFYNSKLNTHLELIAFNKLVIDAKLRHKAFFEHLGIH